MIERAQRQRRRVGAAELVSTQRRSAGWAGPLHRVIEKIDVVASVLVIAAQRLREAWSKLFEGVEVKRLSPERENRGDRVGAVAVDQMLVEAERRTVLVIVTEVARGKRVRRSEQRIGLVERRRREGALREIGRCERVEVARRRNVWSWGGRNFGRRQADVCVRRDDGVMRAQKRFSGRNVGHRKCRRRTRLL